ncbi:MAG: stage 0 sporulation family protein [Clostridia bacterium]|nr:stage 0 sporulation family protein [Clostridia bacterium]
MDNHEKTPRGNHSGNNGNKKPHHWHNHRRKQKRSSENTQSAQAPQNTSGDSITVRPGRYDIPPTEAQKTAININNRSANNGAAAHNGNNRPHHSRHRRNDRRRENTNISASENSAVENASEVETSNNSADTAPSYSEYIATAGSIDDEIVEELNSITSADAKRIEDYESINEPEVELKKYEIVGIRFKSGGKIYYFDPNGLKLAYGESVIVETSRGLEFGICDIVNRTVTEREVVLPLRTVLRRATTEDISKHEANVVREKNAFEVCSQKVLEHKLGMKLIDVELAFDGSKLLFYFTAEGRVDFRELVKDLAAEFRTRIELRQIGIRDETKLLGGIGICGRPFCCKTFLSDFVQVSIKMAKEQNLSLNSAKISGACGRLMCCLRYEHDTYQEEIKKTPKVDQIVATPDGEGTVIEVQPLAGLVRVRFGTKAEMIPPKVYHRDDVKVIGGKGVKPKDTAENE